MDIVLLRSSGQRPKVLLNIMKYAEQPPTAKKNHTSYDQHIPGGSIVQCKLRWAGIIQDINFFWVVTE